MNELGVYKFGYEKRNVNGDTTNWKICIGAYNIDDAQEALVKAVGNVNITERGFECRLDHLSDRLRNKIVENAQPKKKGPGRPPKK